MIMQFVAVIVVGMAGIWLAVYPNGRAAAISLASLLTVWGLLLWATDPVIAACQIIAGVVAAIIVGLSERPTASAQRRAVQNDVGPSAGFRTGRWSGWK